MERLLDVLDTTASHEWATGERPSAKEGDAEAVSSHSAADLIAVLELARDIGLWANLEARLHRIERTALCVLGCERFTVFTSEPTVNELRSRLATGARDIRTPADRGIAGATFREGRMLNVRDARADSRFNEQVDVQTGYQTRSLLSVPLRGVANEIIGVAEFLNKRTGAFTSADEELALTLGSLTEITLQRQVLVDQYREKQRLDHELELARAIQRSLLPAADPHVPAFDIAGWSEAAAATGGDFYDYFDLLDGRLGFVVADVAGHGMAASLLACETRALIRSAASMSRSLVEIVTSTNDLLYRDLHHERFVVLFLGALDPVTSRLEFVGAGCVPCVYRARDDQGFIPREATTMPLGILSPLPMHGPVSLTLSAGDVVVMATDGFYEWENESGHQFGFDRLNDVVRRHARDGAAQVIRSLHREVSAYANGVRQADDLTAVVIRRL
jgi:sigma-B regulation protein RsbU (phosphoserine phosphatase)